MVTWIKRDKNDIFAYSWGEKFFKNPKTLFVIRLSALILFAYALLYGFIHPDLSKNHFTTAIFWSFFWPFLCFCRFLHLEPIFALYALWPLWAKR